MKFLPRFVRIFFAFAAIVVLSLLGWRAWWHSPSPLQDRAESAWPTGAPRAGGPGSGVARPGGPQRRPEELSPVLAAPDSALGRFQAWGQRYLAASPVARASLVGEGVQLATARRPELKALIVANPREALRQAVPMVVRQQLPEAIVAQLEERVSGRAALRIYLSAPVDGGPVVQPPVSRYAQFEDGPTFEAFVYGRRTESIRWLSNASLNGVALDRLLAVNESPVRRLELGEIPATGKPAVEICPISGKTALAVAPTTPIEEAIVAVEAHGEIVYLCDGSHVTLFEEQLILGEGTTGGPQRFTGILPAAPSPSLGELRVLYIPMTFADQNQIPATETKCYETMRDVADFYNKASFGRLTCMTTVTPPIKLPHTEAWYMQKDSTDGVTKEIDGLGLEHSAAREEARKLGYDSNDYDTVVVRLVGGPRSQGVGGWGGGSSVWIYSDSASIAAHEIGHTFALAHANFWDTGGASAIGPGGNTEYGNPFDVMGGGPFPKNHYNAQAKTQIKWLPADFVQTVSASGTYRVYAFDQPLLDGTKRYALKIAKDTQRTYWGEVRAQFDADNKWIANGMILGWQWPLNGGSNIQLIDTTPASPGVKNDAPVVVGQTFSDFEAGIHFTTIAVNTDAAGERSLDVVVNLGLFPGNRAPTLALAASALNVPASAPVTFTATATDADGDALAYQWLSSDNTSATTAIIGPNAPTFTRSFTAAGQYVVTCIVSDMKGGRATRSLLVSVGNGNGRFSISGRVTVGTQGLQGVYVSTGSSNGVPTDSDGYYTIPNLVAGSYTVVPQLFGYTFTDLFNNGVLVGPNYLGANFNSELTPTVSLTASVPTASEAGPVPGKFTVTRTGPDAEALVVKITAPSGSATITTDYTLNPAPVAGSPYQTLTIPSGQSSLDVLVTPVNDTAAEGPETVTLQLGVDAAYIIAGSANATVTIVDDDTALPKVGIVSGPLDAVENPVRAASFIVSRTGSTAAALTVNLAFTGSAINGTDYTALGATATIPVGASSVAVPVTPIDDAISEGFETVIATVTSNAAYVLDSTATTATVRIVDDDQQVLSLEVADPIAAEVNLALPGAVPNPGVFVVSRAGDTSLPLTVFYALSGTALHGIDFESLPGSVTIPAGQTRASIVITPRFDSLGEFQETVILQLSASATGSYKLGTVSSGTVTIDDAGDLPLAEVLPLTSAREPSTAGKFRFTLKSNSASAVTVNYTVSGTATSGVDYTALSGSVSVTGTAGTNFVDVTVTPIDDALAEDLETITVTITPSAAYQTWEPTRAATIWLYDNEQPTVFVDAHSTAASGLATVVESSGTGKFYLSRTGSTTAALTVNYTMSGTAINGTDYQALSGTATILAGQPGVDVVVAPINDTIFEGTESVTLTLAPGSYGRPPAANASATIYLTDDETSTTTVGFALPGSVVSESAGTVNIPVTLSAAAAVPVTVEYAVLTSGTANSVSLGFNTAMPYWVRIARVGNVFTASRSADGNAWTVYTSPTTLPLVDPVWIGLAVCGADGTLATATFDNVTLTPTVSAPFEGRDVGFVAASGSVSLSGGVYTVSGAGTSLGGAADSCYFAAKQIAGDFTFTARVVSNVGNSTNRFAGIMMREDFRRVARDVVVAQRSSATPATFYFARTNSAITAAGAGVDYQVASGVLTFAPGVTSQNLPLILTDDLLAEVTENVVLTLRNANGAALSANTQHVLSITDNDTAPLQPSIGFAAATSTATEAESPAVLVALSKPVATAVTVAYAVTGGTATAAQDFTLTAGTLTFAPGETTKALPLVLLDDAIIEIGETIQLTLSSPSGATLTTLSTHTLTIVDNDLPTVSVVASVPTATETGTAGQWTFTRTGSTTAALAVNFSVTGTATSGSDYTALGTSVTIPAGSATATLALTALADSAIEGNETVLLTLLTSASYVVGAPSTATVTITDANIATVNVTASDANASETGPDTGTFLFTRTGATTSALAVSFAVTGTATSGSDFTSIGTSVTIPAGQTSASVTLTPINDAITEGTEYVVVSLNTSANYLVGPASFATVAIADNDNPPTVVVSKPDTKSVQIALGNGLNLAATATDDGAPNPLTYAWTQFSGPGAVTFATPNAATTTATFTSAGLYILRVSVSDGQFTVFDEVTVRVGAFVPSDWIDLSLGAPATRGGSGQVGSVFTVTGSGTGLNSTTDSAHFVMRPVTGASSVVARVTSFASGASANALAGVMLRETGYRGARRAFVGIKPGGAVELHTRSAIGGASTLTSGGTVTLPAWFKLERSGDVVMAFRAPDVSGAAGTWVQVGTALTLTALGSTIDAGLSATNATSNTRIDASFDNVALTPAPSGAALVAEDMGTGALAGSGSLSGSTYTLTGSGSLGDAGYFRFQQYSGDVIVTARILSHTGTGVFPPPKGGLMIRDVSLDGAPHGMMSIADYWGGYFVWRNVPGGSTGSNYGGSTANPQWMRIVREGDTVTAWKAVNTASNTPGPWTQQGATQTFSAGAPIYVGLTVDSGSLTTSNTVAIDNFTIVPGNLAPVVSAGTGGTFGTAALVIDATVTDDGEPNPPGAFTTKWSVVSGPGAVTFGNVNAVDTSATFSQAGTYVLRLTADDGEVSVFADATYTMNIVPLPVIATAPVSQQANAGGAVTLSVVAGGTGPFTYQWSLGGTPIAGATAATYSIPSVGVNQAGSYTAVVTNAGGSVTSQAAVLAVVPTGTFAAHQLEGTGYVAGTPLTVTQTLAYPGTASTVSWQTLLPSGWTLLSETAASAQSRPAVGDSSLLTWTWSTLPVGPYSFSFRVAVPANQTGSPQLASLVDLALGGPGVRLLAQPDPLVVNAATTHAADTDRNFQLNLFELTRVIELYNVRVGTVRTGRYLVATTTEDGFAVDATNSTAPLVRYHSADANRDGRLDLLELTRVIELFNTRAGTTRTGAYHVQAGTEDGFAPGP